MKKAVKIGSVIVFVLLAVTVYYYYSHSKKALQIVFPAVEEVEKLHVKLVGDSALIKADIKLKNKSFLKLNIDSIIYNIKLDTATLLSRAQLVNLQLPPSVTDTFVIPIGLPLKRLQREIKKLKKQDSVGIDLDVRVVYATIFGRAVLKYKKTINVQVPVPPEFEIVKMDYVKREKRLFYYDVKMRIKNRGKLDFDLSNIKYDLLVNDHLKGKGNVAQQIHVNSKTDTVVTLPLKVTFENLIKTVIMVITDKDVVNYRLKMEAELKINEPFEENTKIEIEKSGKTELKK